MYQYWYNRLRKLKKGSAANPERATAFKAEFDSFRKEAVRRKAEVNQGDMTLADFASWLTAQQDEADRLTDATNPNLD